MNLTAERHGSPAWQEFMAGTNAVVATTATIAAVAVFTLQHQQGITAGLADEVRVGQVLLVVLALLAAYMLWSPSLAGSAGTDRPEPEHQDRLHVLASRGRIAGVDESTLEWVPFGSGHAWMRTGARR